MLKQLKNLSNPTKELLVMGILNVTPDSFYDGGEFLNINDAIKQANKMIQEGVDIIDLGACSTRPFSKTISIEEEKKRGGDEKNFYKFLENVFEKKKKE